MRLPRDINRQFAGEGTGAVYASLEVLLAPEFPAAVAMAALLHFTVIKRWTEEEEGRRGRNIRIFIWRSRSYPDLDSQTLGPSKLASGRNKLPPIFKRNQTLTTHHFPSSTSSHEMGEELSASLPSILRPLFCPPKALLVASACVVCDAHPLSPSS